MHTSASMWAWIVSGAPKKIEVVRAAAITWFRSIAARAAKPPDSSAVGTYQASQNAAPAKRPAAAYSGCLRHARHRANDSKGSSKVAPLGRNPAVTAANANASGAQRASPSHRRAASQPMEAGADKAPAEARG